MAYKIQITRQAERQLERIVGYITGQLKNPQAAVHLLDQIETAYGHLREQPYMYEYAQDSLLRARGYHKIPVGNYVMIYLPEDEVQIIHIMGYFHSLEDYGKKI